MRILIILSFVLLLCTSSHAQWLRFTDISLSTGSINYQSNHLSPSDISKMYANAKPLQKDLSDYSFSALSGSFGNYSSLQLLFSIRPGHENPRFSSYFMLGLSYGSHYHSGFGYQKENRTTLNSFYEPQGSGTISLDSVYSAEIKGFRSASMVGFSLGRIWEAQNEGRWKFSFGTKISYFRHISTIDQIQSGSDYYIQYTVYQTSQLVNRTQNSSLRQLNSNQETTQPKNGFDMGIYIPLRVSFTLSRNNKFLKRISIFYEFVPGYGFVKYPEINALGQCRMQNSIGLKIRLF